MRSRSSTTPHLPSYFLPITSIQLFHHQSYRHTFPVPNEPAKSEVHQIPSHPAMICTELPHSFFLFFFYSQCSMFLPSSSILFRMLRYYRNHIDISSIKIISPLPSYPMILIVFSSMVINTLIVGILPAEHSLFHWRPVIF